MYWRDSVKACLAAIIIILICAISPASARVDVFNAHDHPDIPVNVSDGSIVRGPTTSVLFLNGNTTFYVDDYSGIDISLFVNGVRFAPESTDIKGHELKWANSVITINYTYTNERLKEQIWATKKLDRLDLSKAQWVVIPTNLDMVSDVYGNILFKNPETGELRASFPFPFAIDSNETERRHFGGKWVLSGNRVTVDINLSDAVYPIVFDPTVETYSTTGTYTWEAPAGVTSVNYLVVAGGGGGGGSVSSSAGAGGGGAGGFLTGTFSVTPGTTYNITVGNGGPGGFGSGIQGAPGENSTFANYTAGNAFNAMGGGGGGSSAGIANDTGSSGGSGGGGGRTGTGGTGVSGQGYDGGDANFAANSGGGGGGASEVGEDGPASGGGDGGDGKTSYITEAYVTYAGGGGGGDYVQVGGTGGAGGGGDGGGDPVRSGEDGTDGLGGGGGGAGGTGGAPDPFRGGDGGSGVVILNYTVYAPVAAWNATIRGGGTATNSSGYGIINGTRIAYINFVDMSSNTPTSWRWYITSPYQGGDINNSVDQNWNANISVPGLYSINMSATNTGGTTWANGSALVLVQNKNATVEWNITPTFGNRSTNFYAVDSSSTTNATDPGSYYWNWTDGNSTVKRYAYHRFPVGVGDEYRYWNVSHNVTEDLGTPWANVSWYNKTDVVRVFFNSTPNVTFTASDEKISRSSTVTFTASDVGSIKTDYWCWTFGDEGVSSGEQNPVHTYLSAGVYDVHLVVGNYTLGVTDTLREGFIIVQNPTPNIIFNLSNTTPVTSNYSRNATVDGITYVAYGIPTSKSFLDIMDSVGTASTFSTSSAYTRLHSNASSTNPPDPDKYNQSMRGVFMFDTSELANSVVLSSDLDIRFSGIYYTDFGTNWGFVVDGFTPYWYTKTGSTDYQTKLNNDMGRVLYESLGSTAYTNITLNSNFTTYINKTGVTPLMLRLSYDFDRNFNGTWIGNKIGAGAAWRTNEFNNTGNGTAPMLRIRYFKPPVVVNLSTPVSFVDMTYAVNASVYNWSFGDGNVSSARNTTHRYPAEGRYTINYSITDSAGTMFNTTVWYNLTDAVYVYGDPIITAGWNATPRYGTAVQRVIFVDNSTNATEWSWDVNDDGVIDSTSRNYTHTYTSSGVYGINHSATGINGTVWDNRSSYIIVNNSRPNIIFNLSNTTPITSNYCKNATVDGTVYRKYDLGQSLDGAIDGVGTSYSEAGEYAYSRIYTNSTDNSFNLTYRGVLMFNTSEIGSSAVIISSDLDLNTYSIATGHGINWGIIIDGLNPDYYTKMSPGATDYQRKLDNEMGRLPSDAFVSGSWGNFTLTSNFTTYVNKTGVTPFLTRISYDFDRNYNGSYPAVVTYSGLNWLTMDLNSSGNGTAPMLRVRYFKPPVVVNLSTAVQFVDMTYAVNASVYNWSFGDGNVSSARNTTHRYPAEGRYTINYSITDSAGTMFNTTVWYNLTDAVYVYGDPIITVGWNATPRYGTAAQKVVFVDNSTNATEWSWDVNDDGVIDSTSQNYTHTYTSSGVYGINHSATGINGTVWDNRSSYIIVNNSRPNIIFNLSNTTPITSNYFGNASIDGVVFVAHSPTLGVSHTFDELVDDSGTDENSGSTSAYVRIGANQSALFPDRFNQSMRGAQLYDTSSIGANSVILSADLDLFFLGTYYTDMGTNWGLVIDGYNPGWYTRMDASDYQDKLSYDMGRLSYDVLSASSLQYINFTLNSNFTTYVNKTGTTPIMIRSSYDFERNFNGTWIASKFGGGTNWRTYAINKSAYNGTAPVLRVRYFKPPVVINFTTPVQFVDMTFALNASSYNWSFGDGYVSSARNTSHTYTSAGYYTVNYSITDSAGTLFNTTVWYNLTNAVYATSDPLVTADWNASSRYGTAISPPYGVASHWVNFTDRSTNATSWTWDVDGDGVTDSTDQNLLYKYTLAGAYTVNHSASDKYNTAWDNRTFYIVVNNTMPILYFNETNSTDTVGQLKFWLVGQGRRDPGGAEQGLISTGRYYRYVTSSETFNQITGRSGTSLTWPSIYIGLRSNATQDTFNYSYRGSLIFNTSIGANSVIKSSDIGIRVMNPTHEDLYGTNELGINITGVSTPAKQNNFSTVDYQNYTDISYAGEMYDATAFADYTWHNYTLGRHFNLYANKTGKTHLMVRLFWDVNRTFTGTWVSHEDAALFLFYGNGSGTSVMDNPVLNISYYPAPSVYVNYTTPVQFVDMSDVPNATSWYWMFGDGVTSASQNPTHTYTSPGTYSVNMSVTDSGDTLWNTTSWYNVSDAVIVAADPPTTSDWNATPRYGTASQTVVFVDNSTNATIWSWDANGDGVIDSTSQNYTYTYTQAGAYSVNHSASWYVESWDNRSEYIIVNNSITVGISANATTTHVCVPVQFTSTATGANITDYMWDFGDGTSSASQNPTHTYMLSGVYTVIHNVTDSNGTLWNTSGTSANNGYITASWASPNVDFYADTSTGDAPLITQFHDSTDVTGYSCGDTITSWSWTFGDGATDSVQNPLHTYTGGIYDVSLTVNTVHGSGTKTKTSYINAISGMTGHIGAGGAYPNASVIMDVRYNYDVYNGTYFKYWLFNLTQYGEFNLQGFGYSMMLPMISIFGYWIFLIIWLTYLASVWIRSQDLILPLVIGLITAGVWGILIPAEAYLYIGVMFAICVGVILVKLVYQP